MKSSIVKTTIRQGTERLSKGTNVQQMQGNSDLKYWTEIGDIYSSVQDTAGPNFTQRIIWRAMAAGA